MAHRTGSAPRSGAVEGGPGGSKRPETGSEKGSDGRLAPLLPAPVVVDHERPPLEAVALAEPVLQEEAVVPREQAAVRDLDREARRARLELRHVEEPEALAAHGRGLARRLDVGHEAVQLARRYALVRAIGEVE